MELLQLINNDVFLCGDIHGDFSAINVTVNNYSLKDCSLIICGDIGIGFESENHYKNIFGRLSKKLSKVNVHVYMFRGNHDDKSFFDGKHFTEFKFVHILKDYTVLQTPNRNILCIGGAISIDRMWRKRNMDELAIVYMKYHNCDWKTAYENSKKLYWDTEPMVFDETELASLDELNIKIDTVCTHTAPSFCQPTTKEGIASWIKVDKFLESDIDKERETCDKVLTYLTEHNHPLVAWYYGHFHFHNTEVINGIKYTLLDMCKNKMDMSV